MTILRSQRLRVEGKGSRAAAITFVSRPSVGEGRGGGPRLGRRPCLRPWAGFKAGLAEGFGEGSEKSFEKGVEKGVGEGLEAGLEAGVEGSKMEVGARSPVLGGSVGRVEEPFWGFIVEGSRVVRFRRLKGLKEIWRR